MDAKKELVINALHKWLRQRPGLEFGNYGDVSAYRSEMRSITKDLQQAQAMLRTIAWRDSITADHIIAAAKHAYSGRLSIELRDDGKVRIDYCTGQYWPTEYRRAVCAVLSSVLWDYWRDNAPKPTDDNDTASVGDYLRLTAKRELGRGIARRWFN